MAETEAPEAPAVSAGQTAPTGLPRPEDAVAEAQRALQQGDPSLAEETCREVVAARRDVPAAWYLIGKAAMARGDLDDALDAFSRAAAMRPAFAPFRIALGEAQTAAGHAEDALESYRRATLLDPAQSAAWLQRGRLELELGRKERSLHSTSTGTRLAMNASKAAFRYKTARLSGLMRNALRVGGRRPAALIEARAAEEAGLPNLATARLRTAVGQAPQDAEAAAHLAWRLNEEGAHTAALDCCEGAAGRGLSAPDLHLEQARALAGLARFGEAVAMARTAVDARPDDPDGLCILADILRQDLQLDERRAVLNRALAIAPGHPAALRGMASCHADAGDAAGVAAWVSRALEATPAAGGLWFMLARSGSIRPGDPMAARLAGLIRATDGETGAEVPCPAPTQTDRALMRFALFTVLDRAGEVEAAFDCLEQANALMDVSFCPETHEERLMCLQAVFDAAYFAGLPTPAPDVPNGIRPIFIVGMPRSGTSLTEQILAAHPDVYGAGELNFFNDVAAKLGGDRGALGAVPARFAALTEAERADLRDRYLEILSARAPAGCRYAVDKMPGNFLNLGMIATLFPDAPILHCRRDPMDTCFSIYSLHFSGTHGYAYDQRVLGGYHAGYARLMAHWATVLPNPMHGVFYEETVRDPEANMRRLLARLDLPWREEVLAFHETERPIATASSFQAREPVHGNSVGRWTRYADRLQPLAEALKAGGLR
jgi:tetratricopeptide (TPR) repeat protein